VDGVLPVVSGWLGGVGRGCGRCVGEGSELACLPSLLGWPFVASLQLKGCRSNISSVRS